MSEDGTAFLGHNIFQTGIYPVEDIRMNNLIITYTDQDGNSLDDSTQLGDIENINISIEFNEESETAALFDTSAIEATTVSFDTTNLETSIVTPPPSVEEDGANVILIVIIAVGVIAVIGAGVGVVSSKKK